MICNTCGLEFNSASVCPFCGLDPQANFPVDYNELFKEEKMHINFNLKNIVNDVDFRNQFENVKIKEAAASIQYLEKDLSAENIQKIELINKYYQTSINVYKKQQKRNLELFDIPMLQSHVASFNDIVNNCNKFKKMLDDKKIIQNLNTTIKLYNKEIHYIKKYFILPLYDTPGLLNRSKIVKLLLYVGSIFLFINLLDLPVASPIFNGIVWLMGGYSDVPNNLVVLASKNALSVLISVFFSEILFQLFLNLTIKNKNFQVDKNRSYEIHAAVALLSIPLSALHIYMCYGFNILFLLYVFIITVRCILIKKWNLESIIEKMLTLVFCILIFAFSFFFFNNGGVFL